jgi:tetratricopeptide (TPR) repeat protein
VSDSDSTLDGPSPGPSEPQTTPTPSAPQATGEDEIQPPTSGWLTRRLPLVTSALSLVIAAASAFFAYDASQDAYVSDRRSELIAVVAQLNENVLNGELEEGSDFLIAQAVWLADTVPDVPSAVYRQIATAIVNETPTYQENALPLLEEAMKRAAAEDDEYEQVAALRVRANIYEAQGDVARMREDYEEAIELSASYDGPNLQRRHTVPAFTHAFWGYAEIRAEDCAAAADQLAAAREHAAIITGSNLDEWINGLDSQVTACSQ